VRESLRTRYCYAVSETRFQVDAIRTRAEERYRVEVWRCTGHDAFGLVLCPICLLLDAF